MTIELDGKIWKQVEDVSTLIDDEKVASGEREYRVFYKDILPLPKLQVLDFVLLGREGCGNHFAVVTKVYDELVRYEIKTHAYTGWLRHDGFRFMMDDQSREYKAVRVYRDGQQIWDIEGFIR